MPPYTRHPSQIGISSQKWIELVKRLRRVDSLNFPAHTAGDRAAEAFLKQFTFPLEDKISKYDLLIIHLEQHDGKIPRWARSSKHTTARQVQAPSVVEPEKSWTQRVQEKFGSLEEGKKQALQMLQRLYPLRPQHLEEDTGKINALWKSFNMSGELRQQLVFELANKGVIPVWAEQHKNLSMDVNNPDRFKHIQDMTDPQIAGQAGGRPSLEENKAIHHFSPEFLTTYAATQGYQINRENAFFLTHISGVFRGDHRTPHELADDGKLLAFEGGHTWKHTTDITLCSSTHYRDAIAYGRSNTGGVGGVGGAAQFHYGYQNDPTYYDFDSEDSVDSNDSDADQALRRRQKDGFVYLIDTRGLEAVPVGDNSVLNPYNSTTGGMTVPAEVHISVPATGIPSNRIWLVNSDGTKAVKIDDLYRHFKRDLYELEEHTLSGGSSEHYESLFYKSEQRGLKVLNMSDLTRSGTTHNVRYYQHADYPLINPGLSAPGSGASRHNHPLTPSTFTLIQPMDGTRTQLGPDRSDEPLAAAKRDDVTGWRSTFIIPEKQDGEIPYNGFDGQVIVQLEDDPTVMEAASDLAAKRPGASVLFQLDAAGALHLVYGDPSLLRGNLRWYLVGHGRGDNESDHNTLAGYTASELAKKVADLSNRLDTDYSDSGIRSAPSYVSLVGCALTDNNNGGYTRQFALSLKEQGITADVSGRRTPIIVDRDGRKFTRSADNRWINGLDDNKLVLTWDQQNKLIQTTHLNMRVTNMLDIINKINVNQLQLTALNSEQQRVLAYFFPRPTDGSLDIQKVASLIKNRWQFQLFINNTQHLLQSPRAQRQLATSSGKKALLQSHIWHEKQSDVIATWHGIATEQGSVNLKLAPQALFIGDGSPYARASATATSLAWLDSQAQGGNASENYLNGLNNYADIHEQRAEGPLSDNDTQQVQQLDPLFDRLLAVPEDHPRVFIRQSLPTTYADVALGHYLLNIGSDTLTLSKSNDGFSLYDPTVGTLRITGPKANQILTTTLQTYLRPVSPGPTGDQQPALPPITLYKVDMAAAQTHFPTLAPLQDLLSDYQTETQRLANAADITLSEVVIPARILNKMGARVRGKPFAMQHLTQADLADQLSFDAKKLSRYLHQADYNDLATQQAVRFLKQQIASKGSVESVLVADGDAQSRVSALAQLQKIHQYVTPMLNPEALPDQHLTDHTAKLTLQIDPTLGATVKAVPVAPRWGRTQRLSSRLGGTMQGYGYLRALSDMAKYDALLQSDTLTAKQKEQITFEKNLAMSSLITNLVIDVTQEGLGRWGNRLTRLGVRSGFKLQLARFGGPALGVLSSGFDIYQALRAFSELAATTDPKLRQDLIVTGSLSTAGALVSIGVPIAFAVGGTAASVAGPLGITVRAALLLAGAIYSAVREVENIKKILTLTDWETLRSGWFAFTGQDQEPHIANQLMRHETEQAAQRILQEKRQETAIALLRANINIETLYLSLGQPDLAERSYDKVTAMGENGREILRDKISPKETVNPRTLAESTLIPNQNAEYHWGRNLYYRDGQLEPSAYKYYDVQFSSADDVVNSAGEVSAQVLKKPFMGAFNQVGTFFRQEEGKQKTQLPGLNPRQNDYRSVMGDFNGDGQQDIGYFSTQGLSLLLADGKGGYAQPQLIEKGKLIDGLTVHTLVGDIDHDGKDDIVITIGSGEPIRILLAKENNTFIEKPQPIRLALSYSSDAAPVLLDIDRDGHADLVSWSRQLTPAVNTVKDPRGYINISYGKADGTFERSASLPFSQLKVPQAAVSAHTHHVAGDINGDGYGDLVTLTAEGNLYTLLGTGDRANPFKAQDVQQHQGMTQLARNLNTAQIQLRDMNNDNRADLVLIQDNGNHSIAYGKSDGYFAINTEVKPQQGQPRQNLLALRNEHQILGIRTDAQGNNQLLSLNKAGEINAHPFTSTPPEERVAWFSLGGGNDDAMGHQEQKNIFEVGAGKKRFIGGRKADTFLLMGQAAPQDQRHASVLNGGDLSPSDNADTVMAAIKRDGSGGYHIDLTAGIARYRSSEKIIAKLQQIEHADGHSETDDELMGNSADNKLNGMGGRDVLNGYAGNDWLTLQAGQANGGVGIDTYRILQSHSNAQVVLSDTPNTQEHSAVLLDYLAADIVSITMEDANVVLTLRNKNKTHTQVFLRDMYSARVGNQRTLQHNYALYTYDGLHLTGWPSTLSPKSEGSVPSLPNLTARYIAIHDRSRAAALKTVQPGGDVSVHLQVVDGRGQVEIKVNDQPVSSHADNSPTVLPSFLQLALVGTKFHTTLTGDNKDNYLTALPLSGREDTNRLWHQYSYDTLMGKGGADTYEIGRSERGIWIDNEDDGSATGGEAAQDRLLLPWSLKETQLIQAGNDIVLRHRDTSASYPIIRIRHFMQDERYRHLWLQEKNGLLAELFINQGQVVIGRVDVSEQDDHVVVLHESALIDKKIALLDGDDSFSDLSDTDCQITGGRGDDTLLGGAGNNVYCYATGDGHDAVQDKGGNDRLDFTSAEINKDALWLEKVGYDLRVRVKGRGSSEGVTIKNHYRGADSRIEKIIAGGFQLSGNSIDQLAETMASFSTTASVSSPSTSSLSTQINRHWITVSAA